MLFAPASVLAQGIAIAGVGAVNRSMGGAAVAAPIDAAGTVHWNPAGMSALEHSEASLNLELLKPDTTLSSSVDALGLSGSTESDSSAAPIANGALVHHVKDSNFTYGVGFFTIAGYSSDYQSSATNPVLTPQPPTGSGLGHVMGRAEILQFAPSAAYRVTDRFSVGIAPTLTMLRLEAEPLFIASPNANGYATATSSDWVYGGGFQVGALYRAQNGFNFGASLKSPQWMDDIEFTSSNELGLSRRDNFEMDYPMIASIGTAYTGLDRFVFAVDVRYFDYGNTAGFEDSGFSETGAARGLGWDSVFAVAAGVQYSVTDRISLRVGHVYNQNPIDDDVAMFNVASPLVFEHVLGIGASFELAKNMLVSLTYLHGFENSVEGPIVQPGIGAIPGTSVKDEAEAEAIVAGLSVRY